MNIPKISNDPICIDCDGTLIRTDLLHESIFLLIKQAPLALLLLPFWLFKGKANLKEKIAERVRFEWDGLPYVQEILEVIASAKANGRTVVLVTASPIKWAQGISNHLGVFDSVWATDGCVNLSGVAKAEFLCGKYGAKQFEYAGNSSSDLPVWKVAKSGIVVSTNSALIRKATSATKINQIISKEAPTLQSYIKCARIHQWLKNLLVFLPLIAAHQVDSVMIVANVTLSFFAFSFCASAVYVLNDLLDLDADRSHVRKRRRSFASGEIPVFTGVVLIPMFLCASIVLASLLPLQFRVVLLFYFFMTMIYSVRLKKQVIVDVVLLATLYTLRIIAGAAATNIVPSFWLLAFSMFIFLSLAIVKRYSELSLTLQLNKTVAIGRGYSTGDLPMLASIGVSAGMAAVLVLALYINDSETALLYPEKMWLWLVPPALLYWTSRVWLKACRGEIDDDPVIFALTDWQSLMIGGLLACCFFAASYGATFTVLRS
jgi:4-hydroxybenzoate polyprenyltransferase